MSKSYAADQAELARDLGLGQHTRLDTLPHSDRVDTNTVDDIIDAVRRLASRVSVRHVSDSERLSRAGYAADAARDLRDIGNFMNPYVANSRHSRVEDMMTIVAARGLTNDRAVEAAERIALADQHRRLTRAIAWESPTDLGPLTDSTHAAIEVPSPAPTRAAWLATLPTATVPLGPGRAVPSAWQNVPSAYVDPAVGTDISAGGATIDDERRDWHTAALGTDVALPAVDWATGGAQELEVMLTLAVDEALERTLLADLATDAPPAASFEDAEAAVGTAWGGPPDLILTSPTDRPAVVRQYASENIDAADRPSIVATIGVPDGTAYVLASAAVRAEVSDAEWLVADRPREMGRDIALVKYGLAMLRIAGALQAVTIGGDA